MNNHTGMSNKEDCADKRELILIYRKCNNILPPEEIQRVKKILYPSQQHDFQIKSELNKLTWQTYDDVIKVIEFRAKENPSLQLEIIREVIQSSVVQNLYAPLYAQIVSHTCGKEHDEKIINQVFELLCKNENDVKCLRAISNFLKHWLSYKGIIFNDVYNKVKQSPEKTQLILLCTIFKDNAEELKQHPELCEKLNKLNNNVSIPFQYKVDYLNLEDSLKKGNHH